ncbi:MAG: cytochrome c [Sedimenticolaceae bacterium]
MTYASENRLLSHGWQKRCAIADQLRNRRRAQQETTMKAIVLSTAIALGFVACPVLAEQNGEELFKYHGCINCHGAEARNPVSKVVPKLAGKPQQELFEKAKKILSGEGASKESEIMHAAFYSPAQCDMPPDDAELTAITSYIASIK